ncbi:ABC transporter ATP-binding protein [Rhizobium sp. L1K21]|uniref:ABC transporter ATP-binding protein n=1 Tax=Rhizobium sp. L1K21 TaxID=2954933 RepID=UPI0020939FAF|nr:sn-glycerol-3-phosphate ABC transporter ATP-binding protein UgpC [Rhizobium sp. L1K21]MCO6188638.1 sn-glycerol-3-phosphate ABC transporter ATP-binding protein UgpC [Rhizobium sp. L1K21]
MASIIFEGVEKRYPDGSTAIRHLDLEIKDGEFLVLVGPSGCGKSTALRMIAGLEDITGGQLKIGGNVANGLAPRDRDVAMVFQSYALYPHMSVEENIGFGLSARGVAKEEIALKVQKTAELLELEPYLKRKPGQLSGGQRQRVAMGRALVREPNAFLMDEPLSNLDARLRGQMRAEIARLQKMTGVTTVYVTHDQIEAMTMGDRVAVMRGGVLQQLGAPRTLYDAPDNLFVAGFIGTPSMNFVKATVIADGKDLFAEVGAFRLPLDAGLLEKRPALNTFLGKTITLGIRPEVLATADEADASKGRMQGNVAFVEDFGATQLVHLDVESASVEEAADEDAELTLSGNRLRAALPASLTIKSGDVLTVTVDPVHVHFFDPETEQAIRA